MPRTISAIRRSTMSCTDPSKVRTVPPTVAVPGMMLSAVPAWISVTDTTSASRTWRLRETMVGMAAAMATAAGTGSRVSWGIAPWPPAPRISTAKVSAPARSGPGLVAIVPSGTFGALWMP